MRFEPVVPVRAYQAIVGQIEDAVRSGALVPGDRLPSERELMTQFGVGRSTVREALRVLESSGIARSRPGDPRGPEVLAPTPAQLIGPLGRLARASAIGIGQLVQFLMMVEGWMYMDAARAATPADLERMDAALEALERCVAQGGETFGDAARALHTAVAEATGNPLIQWCGDAAREAATELVADRLAHAEDRGALMAASVDYRRRSLAAIRSGDGITAGRLARWALYDYYADAVPEPERSRLHYLAEYPDSDAG
jgi:GntR family transcriptional repressor for pyruvate dehydrogenase complex